MLHSYFDFFFIIIKKNCILKFIVTGPFSQVSKATVTFHDGVLVLDAIYGSDAICLFRTQSQVL